MTIRKLDNIQRELNALPYEEAEEDAKEKSLVDWFLALIGVR